MDDSNEWKELKAELRVFSIWVATSLIDSVFLAMWVAIQWLVNEKIIANLQLSGIDQWVLLAFQILFAFSTLAPVATYIYVDIRVMVLRGKKRLEREIELNKSDVTHHSPD
jgi:hypothetical protein